MRMINHDVDRAVDFITAQVAFEEDKVKTRRLREAWEASQSDDADSLGDLDLLTEMIRHAPDRHFDMIVNRYVNQDLPATYVDPIISEAMARPSASGLPALARLADRGLLPEHGTGAQARQALLRFLGDAPPEVATWHFAVVDRLDRMELAKSDPDHP